MSKLSTRLAALARSPKARAALEQARQQAAKQAAKPENRRRIAQLKARLKGGGGNSTSR
jgi:hypothetical protein